MTAPFTKTVTIVRRAKGKPDLLGNDTWVETANPAQAVVALRTGQEQTQGRDTLTERLSIYLAAETVISHTDAVYVDGERWDVDGTPTVYEHALTGWKPGVEVGLRRVRG